MVLCHIVALLLGTILDGIIGDPHGIWHPVCSIGNWISFLEGKLVGTSEYSPRSQKRRGFLLVFLVLLPVFILISFVMFLSYRIHILLGMAVEAILSCYTLALRSLIVESWKVVEAYEEEGLTSSREALSMIVGRDTSDLTEEKIWDATIETVAENASDGVVAPFFYLLLGGPVLGLTYKAINTMDSMVGYRNDRYENFGFAAAKLDDIVNFLPSRLTGLLTILVASTRLGFSRRDATRIFLRDRYKHKSPNSAQSEAAFAGALGLRLGGPSYYFGELVSKPYLGEAKKEVEIGDVRRAHLLLKCIGISLQLCLIIIGVLVFVLGF